MHLQFVKQIAKFEIITKLTIENKIPWSIELKQNNSPSSILHLANVHKI